MAGKKIVPECIQRDANPKRIAQEIQDIFTNEIRIAEIKSELGRVRESLGHSGASQKAAEKILSEL